MAVNNAEGNLIDACAADISTIQGQAPFSVAFKYVTTDPLLLGAVPDFPAALVVVSDSQEERPRSAMSDHRELLIDVFVWLRQRTPDVSSQRQLLQAVADVRYAMTGKSIPTESTTPYHMHAGTCHTTFFRGVRALPQETENIVGAVARFACQYEVEQEAS